MRLEDYIPIVGESVIEDLRYVAQKLKGKVIRNINSTAVGGGVAEILSQMIPLCRELEVDAQWDVIKGGSLFYDVTKRMHNGLHGTSVVFEEKDKKIYWETQELNWSQMNLDADIMFIHDPQPAGLVMKKAEKNNKWIWRCHIDLSSPIPAVWDFLKPLVEKFDSSVFSSPRFAQDLPIPQVLISPSIDPLSDKNKDLPDSVIAATLDRFQIPTDKPLITQVSRFDRLKDPVGVIEAYRLVKPYIDCQLLLVGGSATDDPEGTQVLAEVRERASNDPDIHVLELPPTSHIEINALQRASTIVLQKSIREGFGLTVAEALWKGKPVIAGAVGGIPLQIQHRFSGILTNSVEGTAYWLKQLLQNHEFAERLGQNGREHVRDNFLLLRHLRDYLLLFVSLNYLNQDVVML